MKNKSIAHGSMPMTFTLLACACVLLLAACAGPMPIAELQGAREALQRANASAASENAGDIYTLAASRVGKAEQMMRLKRYKRARLLLQRATAEATLAQVVSEAQTAEKSLSYVIPSSVSGNIAPSPFQTRGNQ